MKRLAFALFLLAAWPALSIAQTLTIQLSGAGALNRTATRTITNAHLTRLVAAYAPACKAQNLVGVPPVPTDCTNAQIFDYWAGGIFQGTINNVLNAEQGAAATTAAGAVTPIQMQ